MQALQSTGCTDVGRVRKANEDAMLLLPQAGLFAVADGMGGAAGGEFASKTTLDFVARAAQVFTPVTTLEERIAALRNAVDEASREIRAWAEHRGIVGTGTTVVALLFDPRSPDRAMLLHAGDSRAYLLRGGRLQPLTRDHSVAESYAHGRDEAVPSIFRNVVTNAIGLANKVRLEDTPVKIRPGDTLMLCSDGLYRMVTDEEIGQTLATPSGLEEQAQTLLKSALDHGGKDNVTLVLVRLDTGSTGADADGEPETHDTEVRSAREAARRPKTPTHGSTHDSTIVGRSFTDERDTHERAPVVSVALSSGPSEKRKRFKPVWIGLGAGAALMLAGFLLSRHGAEEPVAATTTPPVAVETTTPAAAPEPEPPAPVTTLVPAVEPLDQLLLRARETGRWNFPEERLNELSGEDQVARLESVRAWRTEWLRARKQPDQVRAELALFRNDITKTIAMWNPSFSAPSIDPWSDDPEEAANLYCRYRLLLQDEFFSELDVYVGHVMQMLTAFGGTPDLIETRLRAASLSRDSESPQLGPRNRNTVNMTRGLNRWKENARHLPVGLAESRNVTETFLAPLEAGLRASIEEVAAYLREIPTLPEIVEARPSVRSFYDQKNQLIGLLDKKAHQNSTSREELAPLLREVLYAPGLADIAAGNLASGGGLP